MTTVEREITPKEITAEARRRALATVEEIKPDNWIDPHLSLALKQTEEALIWISQIPQERDELDLALIEHLAERIGAVASEIRTAVEDLPIYTDQDEEVSQ